MTAKFTIALRATDDEGSVRFEETQFEHMTLESIATLYCTAFRAVNRSVVGGACVAELILEMLAYDICGAAAKNLERQSRAHHSSNGCVFCKEWVDEPES